MSISFCSKANLQKIYGKDEEKKVGVAGFEPATSCSQSRRDNRATLYPEKLRMQKYKTFTNKIRGEEGIRTPGTRKRTTP